MSRTHGLRRVATAAAVSAVVLATGAGLIPAGTASASSAEGRAPTTYLAIGKPVRLPAGDRVVGRVPAGRTIRADVVLQPRSATLLTQYATAVSTPRSPVYRHFESPAEFRAEFAPSASARAAIVAALRAEGLRVLQAAADGLVIPVEATAARMGAAFHTVLDSVRLAHGRVGIWAVRPPEMPASVAPAVLAVLGLDDLVTPEPLLSHGTSARHVPVSASSAVGKASSSGGPEACPAASIDASENSAFTDDEVAHAYGLDGLYAKGILGAGVTIGLFEEDTYDTSDLLAFDECYFGADHTDQVDLINIDGGEAPGPGAGEAALDVEDVSAYAPAADIDVYDAPGTLSGWVDEMAAIVNQDRASVINVSYGLCETQMAEAAPGLIQTENVLFEEAALQGQTFVVASGDSGSETCFRNDETNTSLSVSDPASQPFAVSVGGTSLKTATFPPVETVWNDGGSGAIGGFGENGSGGGGVSQVWPMPAWQAAASTPGVKNRYSTGSLCGAPSGTDCHEVPDVTASADELHGDTIVYGGSWTTFGGTSASAPKWTALLALTDSYSDSHHLPPVGFAAPALYQIASNPVTYAEAFNDITVGNNDVLGEHDGAYPATAGYDLASGLGSPRATNEDGTTGLTALLSEDGQSEAGHPVLTAISPAFGSYTGGTSVTLTGTDLTGVTEAQFGPANVRVTPSDINGAGTSITIDTPASPTEPFNGSTPIGGVAVAVSGPKGTSATSAAVEFHYVAGSSASPVPSVFYISPTSAQPGAIVTVHGSGFLEGGTPTVQFGSADASDVTVVSDTVLTVEVPAEPPTASCTTADEGVPTSSLCQVEVTVTNDFGTSATQTILPPPTGLIIDLFIPAPGTENVPAVTEFDYAPAPVLTSVSPDVVGLATALFDPFSPDVLTITGTGFNYFTLSAVLATIPGDPSLDQSLFVGVIEPTSIEVEAPVFGEGGSGSSPAISRPRATGPPTSFQLTAVSGGVTSNALTVSIASASISVTSLSRHSGSTAGGTTVAVTGHGLTAATGILYLSTGPLGAVGTTTQLTIVSSTKLTFVTPAMIPGPGYFSVCDASVCSGAPPAMSFSYYEPVQPVVSAISPSSGSAGGGEEVAITGTGLGSVTAVHFGPYVTTAVRNPLIELGSSTTTVLAQVPPGAIGKRVAITVVTLAGTSKPAPVHFTYERGAPGSVVALRVWATAGALVVTWKPPHNDGGSPVTGYVVSANAVNNPFAPAITYVPVANEPASARSAFLPVTPDVAWTVVVRSTNARGSRNAKASGVFVVRPGDDGYAVAAADGTVLGYGDLGGLPEGDGGTRKASPVVGVAVTPPDNGYWTVSANGAVGAFGQAKYHGSLRRGERSSRAVAIVADETGLGYWVVTAAGGVYAFGDAGRYGHPAHRPASPIVSAAATFGGYWLLSRDGKVYAFGTAKSSGDLASYHVTTAAVAIIANPAGKGYWIVTRNGGVYTFGGAGRLHGLRRAPSSPVVGAAVGPDGRGAWLLEANGAVLTIGAARAEGSPAGRLESSATGIAA